MTFGLPPMITIPPYFTGFLPLHSDCLLPFYQSAYPHGNYSQYQQEQTEEYTNLLIHGGIPSFKSSASSSDLKIVPPDPG